MSPATTLIVNRRFCGPPTSANGGYTAGALAEHVTGPVEVTLRAPPPLETVLTIEPNATGAVLRAGELLLAEARHVDFTLQLPTPPSYAEAEQASSRFPGYQAHPYVGCFVCGTARAEHDGMRLFPGPVGDRQLAATTFCPDASLCAEDGLVDARFVWAALDCPSYWGYVAGMAVASERILLGRLTTKLLSRPRRDEKCVVAGWPLGREGRRILCASALFGADGQPHAFAQATWIALEK